MSALEMYLRGKTLSAMCKTLVLIFSIVRSIIDQSINVLLNTETKIHVRGFNEINMYSLISQYYKSNMSKLDPETTGFFIGGQYPSHVYI